MDKIKKILSLVFARSNEQVPGLPYCSNLSRAPSAVIGPPEGSHGGGSVGVAEHGVEGAGEVVRLRAVVVFFRQGDQIDHAHEEEEEEELQRQRHPQDAADEGGATGRRRGQRLRRGGTGPSAFA